MLFGQVKDAYTLCLSHSIPKEICAPVRQESHIRMFIAEVFSFQEQEKNKN